ncbi:unnamed protein product [Moneuplotes crassus]|uniref:Uncharacterized protein n=1 Tax=Euplotes crassus TaxID=5936 RepID=A0AAD2CW55_EUPCR|nr:unnamed protein product [Moneuplotes crassus]
MLYIFTCINPWALGASERATQAIWTKNFTKDELAFRRNLEILRYNNIFSFNLSINLRLCACAESLFLEVCGYGLRIHPYDSYFDSNFLY